MKASVPIQVRVPLADAKTLKRAAKARGMKLATYVREAAVRYAETVTLGDQGDIDLEHDTVGLGVAK